MVWLTKTLFCRSRSNVNLSIRAGKVFIRETEKGMLLNICICTQVEITMCVAENPFLAKIKQKNTLSNIKYSQQRDNVLKTLYTSFPSPTSQIGIYFVKILYSSLRLVAYAKAKAPIPTSKA